MAIADVVFAVIHVVVIQIWHIHLKNKTDRLNFNFSLCDVMFYKIFEYLLP
uniref:Ion transport domain-containing protein n=1 Tax=Octopus bimaculoides TaxID=37653 RepID=A0A0L8HEI0_OCTBM